MKIEGAAQDKRLPASALPFLVTEPLPRILLLAGVVMAMMSPEDVLSRFPLLDRFANLIAGFQPSISRYADHSNFREVTKLFFAFNWSISPIFFHCMLREYRARNAWWSRILDRPFKGWEWVRTFIVNCCLAPAIVMTALVIDPGRDLHVLPIHDSRLMLGIFGWMFSGPLWFMCLAFSYAWILKLIGDLKNDLMA